MHLLGCMVDSISIGEHFYQPGMKSERPFPLKVAIIPDAEVKTEHINVGGQPFTVNFHPGLINAVHAELATVFSEVTIIEESAQVKDADLLASVESRTEPLSATSGFLVGSAQYLSRLKVRLKDAKTRTPVTNFTGESQYTLDWSKYAPGHPFAPSAFVVGLKGDVEVQVSRLVRDMSAKFRDDRRLTAYIANRGQFLAQGSEQSSGSPTLNEEDRLSVTDPRGVKVIGKAPAAYVTEHFGKSWAVVIGIDDYEKAPRLKYAVADAKAMAGVLRQQGFQVVELYNRQATRGAIEGELSDKLVDRVGEQDRVVIFYAGHGETKTAKGGKTMGYLLPVEAQQGALGQSAMSMGRIKELADALPSKQVLFLVDVCYGGVAGQQFRSTLPPMTVAYLRQITRERGRQLITAGGPDQQAMESPEWGHSVFTYYLLEGLGKGLADLNEDGIVPASELYSYLDSRVFSAAQMKGHVQRPELWSLAAEKGEFVFIPHASRLKAMQTESGTK